MQTFSRLQLLPLALFAIACFAISPLSAQAQAEEPPMVSQAMLEKLFGAHEDEKDISAAIAEGKKQKVPQQILDEARFLFHIRSETESELPKYIEQFEKGIESYKTGNAMLTRSADEWRALVMFCRAMDSSNKSDPVKFKKQITEAFWLSPENAEMFARPIQQMRAKLAMEKLVVKFDIELMDADKEGAKTSLASHIKGKKAILLDFWASWCEPCMDLMPELQKKAALLEKHGIAVVAMNTEADPVTAASVKKIKKLTIPWLVEPKTEPYSQMFRIDSIPRMVLISPEGKVLYNDHPADPKLWDALKKVAPEIEVPAVKKEEE